MKSHRNGNHRHKLNFKLACFFCFKDVLNDEPIPINSMQIVLGGAVSKVKGKRKMSSNALPVSFTIALTTLATYPPTRELLEQVNKNCGPIKIGLRKQSSSGCWDRKERIIYLDQERINAGKLDASNQVAVLICELLNAKATKFFEQLDYRAIRSEIQKEEYVASMERIEHDNGLKTHEYVKQAIKDKVLSGVFVSLYFQDFETHYKYQQIAGHSSDISDKFDRITHCVHTVAYRGTWKPPYKEEDKEIILRLFNLHGFAHASEDEKVKKVAEERLQKALAELKERSSGEERWERILAAAENFLFKKK
jgi:hypothetical protein